MAFHYEPKWFVELKDSYDAVVVGAGGAGLTAAIQAAEMGLHVAVFEKQDELGGNTKKASSGMNAAETHVQLKHGVIDSTDDFYKETLKGGGYMNDREMLRFFVNHTPLAIDWLADHKIDLSDLTITGGMSKPRAHRPADMSAVGGYLVSHLLQVAASYPDNIEIFNNCKVKKIEQDEDGNVTGVLVGTEGGPREVATKAVLLASGGFGHNKDMIKRYRPDLVNYETTNGPGSTGDGIKLATDCGAQLTQMDLIQIHPTVYQDGDHPYLIGEAVRGEGAILCDFRGHRFVNELTTRKIVSNAITALPEHSAFLIFGQGTRDHAKSLDFYESIGLVKKSDDLAGLLGGQNNEHAKNLEETVEKWNMAVKAGKDEQFGRTTGMQRPIEGPFYAIHIAPAIHYTMGGVHVNSKTQVIDENGNIIKGLYAAGEVAGGLHGNNRIGGNSIAETVVNGREAGLEMAAQLEAAGMKLEPVVLEDEKDDDQADADATSGASKA